METNRIEKRAKEILAEFPQIKEQPVSISGNFHLGETIEQHLERCKQKPNLEKANKFLLDIRKENW